jgi:hypothetical protein
MTKENLINLGFTEAAENTLTRTFSRMVDVAFYGEMESSIKATVVLLDNGAIIATYEKNGRVFKHKVHSFGSARAINAIKETIRYCGYTI